MSAEMLQEIKAAVDKLNPILVELRSEVDALKASQPKDVVTEEKHQKMADEVTRLAASIQEAERKQAVLDAAFKRGEQGQGKSTPETKAAFDSYLRQGVAPEGIRITSEGLEVRAMSTDDNPNGGYLVRPEFANFVIDRVFETSPVRAVASVIQMGAKSMEVLIDDNEADFRWAGEGASGGETNTPAIGRKEIAAHKSEALPKLTTEQIEDSFLDVEAWIRAKGADKLARGQNTAFVNGTGVGQPRGFLTYPAWASAGVYERGKIEQVKSGAAAALTSDGLITLQNSLKEAYQANARFAMRRTTFGAALKLKGADNYFFSPVLLRDGQGGLTLLGKPVVFMDDIPAIEAGALAIVYADFSRFYTVAERVGLQVLRDPFTSKGFITYYMTQRVGGDVTNYEAAKIQNIAA